MNEDVPDVLNKIWAGYKPVVKNTKHEGTGLSRLVAGVNGYSRMPTALA